ncbi:kelch 4 [Fusarium pseudocircinatum]|uniref:Kelch 4 n=1 Tax=Fusarium pseudocircinatum TaxID=56676 RepID=A0A8H5PDF4_9HYPO|nr:kelch 4 [Fusarium pseudocircinatum]
MTPWSVKVFDHVCDQRSALGNLLKTGDFSDLVIICGQERHKVHKAIEAQIGAIELPDDDPFAVSMMIEYLYHQTYTIPYDVKLIPMYQRPSEVPLPHGTVPLKIIRHSDSGDSPTHQSLLPPLQTAAAPVSHPQDRASPNSFLPYVNIYVHYKVYTLGEKYSIAGLKALAVRNFETEGGEELGSSSVNYFGYLIHMMKEAYNCTAEGDRPLRDAVVRVLKSKPNLFKRSDMKEFLKEEGLAYDLAMSYVQEDQEKNRGSLWLKVGPGARN